MPRIAGLTPFTKADTPEKDSALADSNWHSEGEEDFASRPPTEQIKRRLSGVENPQAKKVPIWQSLTVSLASIGHIDAAPSYPPNSPCTLVSLGISLLTRL